MTEAEWLACAEPAAMLRALQDGSLVAADGLLLAPPAALWPSDRKLRLFACVCCRRIWHLLTDPSSRRAVEVSERYADGEASQEERDAADAAGAAAAYAAADAADAAAAAGAAAAYAAADAAAALLRDVVGNPFGRPRITPAVLAWDNARARERIAQAALLRDVVGNPFRRPSVAPAVLAWHGGTVPRLAAALYVERRFERLPVLADALEEAGCTDVEILAHCRGPGPHVRGCWAVDLVLGKS
jgi:hypothetical protein